MKEPQGCSTRFKSNEMPYIDKIRTTSFASTFMQRSAHFALSQVS
eukprot:UN21183